MTLSILPEHGIRNMHQEPAVAHITFANEASMQRFTIDNRRAIRTAFLRWTVDFEPLLTVTAAR